VKLKTEWLRRQLLGEVISGLRTSKIALQGFCDVTVGRTIQDIFCKGKHIFIDPGDGSVLHNHLLMRGRWKGYDGRLLLLPDGVWLAIEVGARTVCNVHGQMLRAEARDDVQAALDSLGPDVMAEPYPAEQIMAALAAAQGAIGPALLEQDRVCGLGNIAKSEALYRAGIDPRRSSPTLDEATLRRLSECIHEVCWRSYRNGGRWQCDVYQHRGRPCRRCGHKIVRIVQEGRATYFCPSCQR